MMSIALPVCARRRLHSLNCKLGIEFDAMSDLIINTLGVCKSEVNPRCQPRSPLILETGYLTFPWDSLIQLDCLARQPQGSTHISMFLASGNTSICWHLFLTWLLVTMLWTL